MLKSACISKAVRRPCASADDLAQMRAGWRLVVEAMDSVRV